MTRSVRPRLIAADQAATTLVIALHGCTRTSAQRATQLGDVISAIRESLPSADVFAPLLPIEYWSLQDADAIVAGLLDAVNSLWTTRERTGTPYERVVLVGFSFGSVLLRQLYCRAAGARPDGVVVTREAAPWVRAVERMVLVAGLNRGWTTDSPVSRLKTLSTGIGTAIGHVLPVKPTLFAIRRGAPFLTRTRLQWLALGRAAVLPRMTVQLLGTRDDIVSPADNVDLATGGDFLYLEVAESGHFDVVNMDPSEASGRIRRARFILALTGTPEEVVAEAVSGEDLIQMLPIGPDTAVDVPRYLHQGRPIDDVVFVVHGIRDKGFWTRKVARMVVSTGAKCQRTVVACAPTYGYFAMLPFLLPWTRRAKVEWLLDMYVSIRSQHPDARVSFIGHSNGTYILAYAIEACPTVHFHNVVFAGSVVPSTFDWSRYLDRQLTGSVLNYVATADWVVAIFPRLLQALRVRDLGGAGHDGFLESSTRIQDVEYVRGRHSAALDEQHWSDIATFVLGGGAPTPAADRRAPWVMFAARAALVFWLLLAATAMVPGYLGLVALGFPEVTGLSFVRAWEAFAVPSIPGWLTAIGLMAWVKVVATVLTRL